MAATRAETQQNDANSERAAPEQRVDSRNPLLQNGTDKTGARAAPGDSAGAKASRSPVMAEGGQYGGGGVDASQDRPPEPYGYRGYPEQDYYGPRPAFPGKGPRGPPPQRFLSGQSISQPTGPTPTLNSLLQAGGAGPLPGPGAGAPHRYPNSYDQPPAPYSQPWGPPRPMAPYSPQPYRNPSPSGGNRVGGAPYGGPPGGYPGGPGAGPPQGTGQQPYAPYPPHQRYPPPQTHPRPSYSPHQMEQGPSPQASPGGAPPSPGHTPSAPSPQPPHSPHQHYPPRPGQPSTPNAHDPESELTGQNSNDSSSGGGGGGGREGLLRPSPSPTGSTGSRSMSPAVGQQNIPMPPRPSSSSQSEGGGAVAVGGGGPRTAAGPPGAAPQPPYPPPPQHYKMPPHHQPYPPPQHQYPQGNYSPRPPYPNAGYGGAGAGPGAGQYGAPGRPPPAPPAGGVPQVGGVGGPGGGPPPPQGYPGWGARAPPPPPHYLKQHLQHKMGPPAPHVMGPPGDPTQQDNGPPATALVTTGPDGAPLDDGSQQSTLSNASAASGEESSGVGGGGSGSASSRRGGGGGAPSPGAASHASAHDDYDASPSSWPRTPSSPVFNSHVPQENYRTKQKSDSLGKLYEMDGCPERRGWVERLLAFMEERRTPIAACPTISKQPLDLYRLYLHVRERGGFVEVTKNKTWKDIAGLLGIGASSSAAYTLRKHYTKNLLAYECHFDRGGIDPQPIINQVEATTKKKSSKNNSVPSPGDVPFVGSSNSQDSFPGGGGPPPPGGPPCDGYGPPYSPYPPPNQGQQGGASGDNMAASNPFEDPQPRRNHQPGGYPAQQGYGYDQYGSAYPSNRPVYPQYGPEQDNRGYPATGGDPYSRYGPGYGGSPGGPRGYPPPGAPPAQGPPAPPQSPTPPPPAQAAGAPPPPQDYYRSPQQQHEMSSSVNMNSQLARQLVAPLSPGGARPYHGYNKAMGPPAGQPRRHPDFAKEQPGPGPQPPYSPIPTQRGTAPPPHHQYSASGCWGNNNSGQFRGQFPPVSSGSNTPGAPAPGAPGAPGQWPAGPPRPPPPGAQPPPQTTPTQTPPWGPQPYPPQQPGQPSPAWGGNAGLRPGQAPPRPQTPYRPDLKPYPMQPQTPNKVGVGVAPKREITFPPDSVEAVTPVTYKRRRLTKVDVAPVEAWRIMMALKSGLLAETCWALDVLNILLFDDSSVGYFGLQHLPGLLDLLLEHFQKSLTDIFDPPPTDSCPWYMSKSDSEKPLESLPSDRIPDPRQSVQFMKSENYTTESRKGKPVIYKAKEDDLFAPEDVKDWDVLDGHAEVGIEPWQFGSDSSLVNHVLPCFQGEFINIPFARVLEGSKHSIKKEENTDCDSVTSAAVTAAIDSADKDTQGVNKTSNCVSERNKKRTKASLSDVINRVKAELQINGDNNVNGEEDKIKEEPSEVREEPAPELRHNGPTDRICETESCDKESGESEDNFKSEPMEIEKDEKPIEKPLEKKHILKINDPAGTLKRRHLSEYEDECYTRDEASLYLISESQDALARRCMCLSNILRNLTFVPGNEMEFSKSGTFLALMGKLLLLHHEHGVRAPRTRNYDREEDAEWRGSCSSLSGSQWWWDLLQQLREDALVCCANIGGQVELWRHPEQVARPVLDGLLHWAVCPAAAAQDPLPSLPPHRALSPRRLALEALCKLCVTDSNVDLVVATPPFPRLQKLCSVLAKHLCRSEDQVLREFSVNLLHYLAAADSGVARAIAADNPTVSLLVTFIEQAEQSALGVANQHGITALRDNPDSMGTSLDMLRRAASTLLQLARHPENKPLFLQQEQRLLSLVMSQILDQKVASELSKVLFQCSRHPRTRGDL